MSTIDQSEITVAQERARLIDLFKDRYGSFESELYLRDERNNKVRLAEHVRDSLDKQQLARLIANNSFGEAAGLIRRTYQRPENNLLNSRDRLPLENASDETLVQSLFDLLYGDAPFETRFAAWVAFLSNQTTTCWPAATFFLMLADPQRQIFIKPAPFRALLVRLHPELPWSMYPTAEAYAQLLQVASDLYEPLRPLGARDMIDVQSFITAVQPENERTWIFQSNPQYYDLPGALAALDRFTWSVRQRAKDMHVGDTVYLWEAGKEAGILAVAIITGEPQIRSADALDRSFYRDNAQIKNDEQRVPLRIERVLAQRLTRADLLDHPQLNKLQIIQQPNSTNYEISESDAIEIESLVAAIPDAPKGQGMQQRPPHPLDGPAFVVIHGGDVEDGQTYGESYVFTNHAGGAPRQLMQAIDDVSFDDSSVYLIIYRPYPYHAFTAWARVVGGEVITRNDAQSKDITYKLKLEHHEFPEPLHLKGNAAHLMNQISWLSKGLAVAFRGKSIRRMSNHEFHMIINAAYPDDIEENRYLPSHWLTLAAVRDFVRGLEPGPHTIDDIHTLAGDLASGFDPETFLERLCWLRLLAPADEERYQPYDYVRGDANALLRLMVLALLLPTDNDSSGFDLPARAIVPLLDGQARPLAMFAAPYTNDQELLCAWYREAGLIETNDTTWRATADALDELPSDDFLIDSNLSIEAFNRVLAALRAEAVGEHPGQLIDADGPIPPVAALDERLKELAVDILVDPAVVRRIYRSLVAGRHVVLSGPPGTGKTELAIRLPSLLWQEQPYNIARLTTEPSQPPIIDDIVQRNGYATAVVTATEDWGVRDVVGGIGPLLDESRRLSYTIQHGALTRAVLQHYANTHSGESLPAQGFTRCDFIGGGKRYRGVWLVIDEFTRAPVDAAFGSLLTTLSGGDHAILAVPTAGGALREVPIPPDFRIIGTLNSFDRHFLNQISEALKRRFDFIDVLPPTPQRYPQEQGIATMRALRRLHENGFRQIDVDSEARAYSWIDVVRVVPSPQGYVVQSDDRDAQAALTSLWRIFRVLRYFRQFGTAQLVALLTNLFAGRLIGMLWDEALDTALADALADQLQVLTRDEQQVIERFLALVGDSGLFTTKLQDMIKTGRTNGRRAAILRALREAEIAHSGTSTIDPDSDKQLTDAQIQELFEPATSLALPPNGIFLRRVRNLLGERGL
jgi:5-methylcytosine-specific restriction enzyme B